MKKLIILLALIFALPSHAATVEVRYTISTPKTVRSPKIAPKPQYYAAHGKASDVQKVAGESAKTAVGAGLLSSSSDSMSEQEIINSMRYPDVIRQIYQGESTSGRNDECRRRGIGYNGFGYGESVTRLQTVGPLCFPTFRDVVQNVDDWIHDKTLKGYSLNVMNCLYVRGYAVENCTTAYKLK